MDALLSYRLEDLLLFSPEVYYRFLALYQQQVWPVQPVALTAGVLLFGLCAVRCLHHHKHWHSLTVLLLAAAWGWCGAVYHLEFYQSLNPMAFYFGWLFIGQSVLFVLWALMAGRNGALKEELSFGRVQHGFGLLLLFVAVVVFPFSGFLEGGRDLAGQVFGLNPSPTLLATVGVCLIAPGLWRGLLILPLLLIGIEGLTYYLLGSVLAPFFALLAVLTLLLLPRRTTG